MDVPRVDTCCCGLLPLKTGCYIVGIVSFIVECGYNGNLSYNSTDRLLGLVFGAFVIFGIISSLLLLWGVYSGTRVLVQLYLIAFAGLLILSLVMVIYWIFKGWHITDIVIETIIYWVVIGYCWVVVNSYHSGG